jgi:hypothetical protein
MLKLLFKQKYKVIIGKNWEPIATIRLSHTPRTGEYLYINDEMGYLNVLNVVHKPSMMSDTTFIIVEKVNEKKILKG